MGNTERNVWYAVYGTNLNIRRFSCYIEGGTPEGSSNRDPGCRDKAPALDGGAITLPYRLYFSKNAPKWENGSVGFVDLKLDLSAGTLGRKYRITESQFEDVFKQENGGSVPNDFARELERARKEGARTLKKSWYGRAVYLGEEEGMPIFTLTVNTGYQPEKVPAPSEPYLAHLVKGLRQTYGSSDAQILEYLIDKPGIDPHLPKEDLLAIIQRSR